MSDTGFVLHGAVTWCEDPKSIRSFPDAYVVCVNGICRGVYEELPAEYANLPQEDFWDKLIIPGMTDLHTHAPQYQFRGLHMDLELMDWLEQYAFPEEAAYKRRLYAERAYDLFVEELYCGATTRAVIFATKHVGATLRLMDLLEETGLVTYVGKVNMDRNVPDYYCETAEESLAATRKWLKKAEGRHERTSPILTPRFTPACSRELLAGLSELRKEYRLPVQSHVSESPQEIELVRELEKGISCYADSYDRCGLLGAEPKTVLAHGVWSDETEIALLAERGVFLAHCPQSNWNVRSGIAPVRKFLDAGVSVGLGSDVAGGSTTSIFTAMKDAVQASKMYWRYVCPDDAPLTLPEVFYMATKGGGAFFGNVGSFEAGYEFDAVVLDDSSYPTMRELTPAERLERLLYLSDDRAIVGKYVRGSRLY